MRPILRFAIICVAVAAQLSTASITIDYHDTGQYIEQKLKETELNLSPNAKRLVADILAGRQHSLGILFEQIQAAARSSHWDSEVFSDPQVFDALLLGYLQKVIDKDTFLDLYNYAEVVYQFTVRKDDVSAAIVKRVTPEQLSDDEVSDWYKAVTEGGSYMMKPKLVQAFKSLPDDKRHFTIIEWECMDCFEKPGDDYANSTPSKQLGGYFQVLDDEAPFAGIIVGENKLILPPFALIEAYRKQTSPLPEHEIVNAIPTMGFHDMQAVRTMRGNLQHPLQLYHPELNNLLYPHKLYAGSLAGRHDFYHLMILSYIAPDQQRSFYFVHDVDQKLLEALNMTWGVNQTGFSLLEKEFRDGLRYITSGQNPHLQRIFERLVMESDRDWLNRLSTQEKALMHNSLDDEISDRALDLPMDDFIGASRMNSRFLTQQIWRDLIFPSSHTYKGFLRLNYQLFHSFADMRKALEERLNSIPVTTRIHNFGFIISIASALADACDGFLPSVDSPVTFFKGTSGNCQVIENEEYWRELFDESAEHYLEDSLDNSAEERRGAIDLESLMLLVKFWNDWLQGIRPMQVD